MSVLPAEDFFQSRNILICQRFPVSLAGDMTNGRLGTIQDSPPSLMTTKTGLQDLQPQPLGMFLEAADGWEQPLKVS